VNEHEQGSRLRFTKSSGTSEAGRGRRVIAVDWVTHQLRSGDESSHVSDAAIKAVSVAMPVPLSSVFEVTGLDRTITRLKSRIAWH